MFDPCEGPKEVWLGPHEAYSSIPCRLAALQAIVPRCYSVWTYDIHATPSVGGGHSPGQGSGGNLENCLFSQNRFAHERGV
jgi:hypothetical protein